MTDIAKPFWDVAHRANDLRSLSGVSYSEVVHALRLESLVTPKAVVLEMGVGMGYCLKEMSKTVRRIDAFDISEHATARVADCATALYHSSEEIPANTYDLIYSNNVNQHLPTNTMRTDYSRLIRALKPRGVFAVQFVGGSDDWDYGNGAGLLRIKQGLCLRSPEAFAEIIEACGGIVDIGALHHCPHQESPMKKERMRLWWMLPAALAAYIIGFLSCSTAHALVEADYVDAWCTERKGRQEVVLSDNTRIDCALPTYSVEFDYAYKWAEAIGQSLHYAQMTGVPAKIVLIVEPGDMHHLLKLMRTIAHHGLKIDVETVPK
jgi:hypothetical protein